ncbi:host cell division inhibitor Icd-like protein [Salmonella enterica]|nr:host cell division inhibitor Icd-like protein [Salmonella enterica]EBQ2382221.1 host cell division inhibitor Icd-like protein [Salmonella enterica]EDA9959207.1 host cell division inhibitor Icd-like protein [Salmonella enterica]
MVCYQHSFPISNRENTVCTPYAPKEKGNAANVALWVDHSTKISAQFVSCFDFSRCRCLSCFSTDFGSTCSGFFSTSAGGESFGSFAIRQSSESTLDFLRCRRLISPRMAVTINCASVSCSSLTSSISLRTSRGTLAVFCCDLLLTVPVAITGLLMIRWCSVYGTKKIKKVLKCKSPRSMFYSEGDLHLEFDETHKCYQHLWASNHNVTEAYIMACSHDTQTRPEKKYRWRFLALKRSDLGAKPCCLSVNASTEREARRILAPHFILSLAARLPVHGGCDNPIPSKHGHITIVQEVAYV